MHPILFRLDEIGFALHSYGLCMALGILFGYAALSRLEVDKLGLDSLDRRMLRSIIEFYHGGPVGLDTLAAAIGEDPGTLEDLVEPYLLQNGLINRTPRGRVATREAYVHLGIPYAEE